MPTATLPGPNNVVEGSPAQVCITIQNAALLDTNQPPTLRLSTMETGSKELSVFLFTV